MANQTLCDVFVVDADAKTRKELRLIATSCGYSVMVFPDGQSVLAELSRTRPRLIILELLLPGLDGFELCQAVRSDLNLPDIPLLCTSGLSWGSIDLEKVLSERFGARFLPKGSLVKAFVKELTGVLGAPSLVKLPEQQPLEEPEAYEVPDLSDDLQLGQEELARAKMLTKEFEAKIANVSLGSDGREVRVQAEYQVQFNSLGELATEFTQNISRGGLFVYSEKKPPGIDEIIGLSLQVPGAPQAIELKARVVHSVSPEQAREGKIRPGFGVEFLNLTREDRTLMQELVQDFESRRLKVKTPAPKGTISIVLLGIPMLPLVGRPNFLLRKTVKVAEFPDLPAAEEYLSQSRIDLALVGEKALAQPGALECMRKLDALVDKKTKRIMVLDQLRDLTEVLVEGLCHMVMDTTLTLESLLDEVGRHLEINKRESMRVPYRARVAVRAPDQEFTSVVVNISSGGMLLISTVELKTGTMLRLGFSLEGGLLLTCRGEVVRKMATADRKKFSYGVKFTELDGDAEDEILKFVQKQVNFREYFRWMKKRYFEWP